MYIYLICSHFLIKLSINNIYQKKLFIIIENLNHFFTVGSSLSIHDFITLVGICHFSI